METGFPHDKLDVYQVFLSFAGLSEAVVIDAGMCAAADHLDRATESIGSNLIRGNSHWSPALRATCFDPAQGRNLCRQRGL